MRPKMGRCCMRKIKRDYKIGEKYFFIQDKKKHLRNDLIGKVMTVKRITEEGDSDHDIYPFDATVDGETVQIFHEHIGKRYEGNRK